MFRNPPHQKNAGKAHKIVGQLSWKKPDGSTDELESWTYKFSANQHGTEKKEMRKKYIFHPPRHFQEAKKHKPFIFPQNQKISKHPNLLDQIPPKRSGGTCHFAPCPLASPRRPAKKASPASASPQGTSRPSSLSIWRIFSTFLKLKSVLENRKNPPKSCCFWVCQALLKKNHDE